MVIDQRRILVLGGTGIVILMPVLVVLYLAVGPIVAYLAQANDATMICQRLHRLKTEQPAYEAARAKAEAELAAQAMPDPNLPAELAGANLQNTLQGLGAQVGAQVSTSAISPPQALQGLQILSVSLSFTLFPDRLAPLLADIAAQVPHLTVQSLDVRGIDNGTGRSPLTVQMRVAEYRDMP